MSCLLRVKSCLPECVSATTAAPQIADDLLQRASRQPWAKSRLSRCKKETFAPRRQYGGIASILGVSSFPYNPDRDRLSVAQLKATKMRRR